MDKNLTVKELYANLGECIKRGYENHKVYISSDEEGNSFNPLFYGVTTSKEDIEGYMEMGCIYPVYKDSADNIVLLG